MGVKEIASRDGHGAMHGRGETLRCTPDTNTAPGADGAGVLRKELRGKSL